MIGKIYSSITPFYDVQAKKNSFKSRPVLIISEAINNDYTVLPISTISRPENRHPEYDIPITLSDYPLLNLDRDSYIRAHKQTTVHKASLSKEISDLKQCYGDLYISVLAKLEQFNGEILNNAL